MWRTSPDLPKGLSAGSRQDGGRSEDVFGGSKVSTGTNQEVSSDQHSAGAGPELPHDHVALLLVHVAVLPGMGRGFCERVSSREGQHESGGEAPTRAETVKSRACIFSVSQSTFLLVLRKMTAWVMVSVSYRSHRVSSFHSWRREDNACKAEAESGNAPSATTAGVM